MSYPDKKQKLLTVRQSWLAFATIVALNEKMMHKDKYKFSFYLNMTCSIAYLYCIQG